jgi:predicted metal-dependent phosphoesterase TrpH
VLLKVDLHTHTAEDPLDAIPYSAVELIDRAADLGYQALAITLHDKQIDLTPLRGRAHARGVVLIPGVERTIQGKHVVLLNFSRRAEAVTTFEDLARLRVAEERGLVVAPHPFYPIPSSLGRGLLDRFADLFDAVEISSVYARGVNFNPPAIRWAAAHRKPLVGNGDVHRLAQLGSTYSLVEAEATPEAICAAIKSGCVSIETRHMSWPKITSVFGDILTTWVWTASQRVLRHHLGSVG